MDFEEIMDSIKLGLTGEVEKDVIYIMQKNVEYKKSPFADKISRETGRMIYELLNDEEKVLFEQVLKEDTNDLKDKLQEIEKEIFECNYMKAIEMIESIIDNILDISRENEGFDYVSLNSLFEMYIYVEIYKKGVLVKPTYINYSKLYRMYGFCLFKLTRDLDAEKAYEKALYWNPISVEVMLDLAEIQYEEKKYKSFLETVKKCFKYSYDISQVALCYYNLGRYYFEKGNDDLATNMYILSHYFKPNKASFNKLEEMTKKRGIKIEPPSPEEMKKICDEIGVPMGVNPDIVKLAASMGTYAKQQGNIEVAKYCYDILFALTGDKAVMDTIFDFIK